MNIEDVRGRKHSLDVEGYTLVEHTSMVTDWEDNEHVTEVYYPEVYVVYMILLI